MFETIESQNSRTRIFEFILLVVIIVVFFTVIITSLNPIGGVELARDGQRQYDVIQISNGVYKYLADGHTIAEIEKDTELIEICEVGSSDIGTTEGKIDLLKLLVPDYLYAMPVDPIEGCSLNDTCYDICKSAAGNRLTIIAPNAETYKIDALR